MESPAQTTNDEFTVKLMKIYSENSHLADRTKEAFLQSVPTSNIVTMRSEADQNLGSIHIH